MLSVCSAVYHISCMCLTCNCCNPFNWIDCTTHIGHARASTLFPYTTLFRSLRPGGIVAQVGTPQEILAAPADEYLLRRSEEHTSELQSRGQLVCRPLLEKQKMVLMCNCHNREDMTYGTKHIGYEAE